MPPTPLYTFTGPQAHFHRILWQFDVLPPRASSNMLEWWRHVAPHVACSADICMPRASTNRSESAAATCCHLCPHARHGVCVCAAHLPKHCYIFPAREHASWADEHSISRTCAHSRVAPILNTCTRLRPRGLRRPTHTYILHHIPQTLMLLTRLILDHS